MTTLLNIYRKVARTVHRLPLPESAAIRRPLVAVVGGAIFLTGLAMVVLPGPAILVIPAGIALLTMEFLCVRQWFRGARRMVRRQPFVGGASDNLKQVRKPAASAVPERS